MNIYYVYIYYTPEGIPFYVGYGKNNRKYYHLNEAINNPIPKQGDHKLNKIRKILSDGGIPKIEIVAEHLTKDVACELEMALISEIGRIDMKTGPLTNKTKGGDGTREWSDELKKQLSTKKKGFIACKNLETGEYLQLYQNDSLWQEKHIVGINHGRIGVSNPNGQLDGYILAKNPNTDEYFRIKENDPRWQSGELVGFNKNRSCHENTRIAASKTWKGVPKSQEHNKKNSEAIKLLKWYCNFETNKVGRFKEGEEPYGYIRVSGPHKRKIL